MKLEDDVDEAGKKGSGSGSGAARGVFWALLPASVGGIGYVFAYLVGLSYYQAYAGTYGLPVEVFPKGASDYMNYAFVALFSTSTSVILAVGERWWIVVVGVLFIFCFGLALPRYLSSRIRWRLPNPSGKTWTPYLKDLFICTFATLALTYWLPFLVAFLAVVPGSIGEYAGKRTADLQIERYLKYGCSDEGMRNDCFELSKGGEVVALGHLIESNQQHVALLVNGRMRTFPLDGASLSGVFKVTPRKQAAVQ